MEIPWWVLVHPAFITEMVILFILAFLASCWFFRRKL